MSVTISPSAVPSSFGGFSGSGFPFTVSGPGTYTGRLTDNGVLLDSATITVSCAGGATWTGSACIMAPTVDLKVKPDTSPGAPVDGPLSVAQGVRLDFTWSTANTDASTTCVASGLWSGNKTPVTGGAFQDFSFVDGTYTLRCTKTGPWGSLSGSDSVDVIIFCPPSCGSWSACAPPCSGGNGTQSQTCVNNKCIPYNVSRTCTTNVCRDVNWKEIGQQE